MGVYNNPWFIVYVVLVCLYFQFQISSAVDKISGNQSLSGDRTISSEEGNFVLGFFKPDLKPTTSSSLEAVLLDDGNFVLRDGTNSSDQLWQSFDHPTDTFLPGCRLGFNKITKTSTRLISWKNKDDPAPGLYSIEVDPNGTSQFYISWNRSKIMWTSGNWDGQRFSLLPEMRLNYIFNYTYVDNENERYFVYSLYNSSIISRLIIDVGGQIQQLSWLKSAKQWNLSWSQPRVECDLYAYCGSFGSCNLKSKPLCHCLSGFHPKSEEEWNSEVYNGGCARKTILQCGNSSLINGKSDQFLASPDMLLPTNPQPWALAKEKAQECGSTCLSDCLCTAYAYDGTHCSFWHGDLLDLRQREDGDPNGQTLYVRLAASEFSNSKSKERLIVVVVGSMVIVIVLGLLLLVILRRTKMRKIEKVSGSPSEIKDSIAAEGGQDNPQLVFFSFKTILAATSNFSEAQKLGEGGFGPVYKGNLPGDQEIAIKRLSRKSGQGLEEFMNELKLIANLQHKYLVRLLGCCVEREEKILIYEYMPNRSLDKFLFDPSQKAKLVWDKRLNIAEGVAQGLLYIHKFSRMKVIHRDLKASNILLDEAMNPKISDFGMARIFGINQTEANTNRVMGTYGYMSPEYAFSGKFSEKSDVFSFGVFLLEIVSGRRNTSFHRSGLSLTLLSWAWELWKEGNEAEIIDPSMNGTCRPEEAVRFIQVGLLCIQEDPTDRPTMSSVVLMLSSDTQTLPSPKEPAFHSRRTVESSSPRPNSCSKNEMTISLPEGR
ncbi:receptor-like serine/threonine-protein kinase SD1-8 isoform X2 [Manihot esculenta]|uniref:receptor-like serine/threonine-protein kinase SD1-8 isoform X2 n=1 Tax=Manihot esculenta TaxID=3983 RepID=UPI001CC3405C|nr:receptor-like serine/threonine-protein kinase SD1-8 isoform X2 [Manihot esculenta]